MEDIELEARKFLLEILNELSKYPFDSSRLAQINRLSEFINYASNEELEEAFDSINEELDSLQAEIDAALALISIEERASEEEKREAASVLVQFEQFIRGNETIEI